MRSVEDGFLGLWHSGTVIDCEDLIHDVEYDHILSDKGSDKLVELINVSPILDGVIPAADEEECPSFCCWIKGKLNVPAKSVSSLSYFS